MLQKEEAKTMTLLDDDSRAVLGLLRSAAPELQQPLQRNAASHRHRAPLASDITNRPPKVCCPCYCQHAFQPRVL